MTQAKLADALGVTPQAVSQWERGESTPEFDKIPAIIQQLDVDADWLFGDSAAQIVDERPTRAGDMPSVVRVVGYVGAGAAAHFYAIAQGDLDEVPAPEGSTKDTVAVEVRGDSLGSLFDRWLVFYDDVRRPITGDLVGKLCVVGLADDRVLIKKVRLGSRKGLYKLISEREDPIDDVAIEWAARVKNMVPS